MLSGRWQMCSWWRPGCCRTQCSWACCAPPCASALSSTPLRPACCSMHPTKAAHTWRSRQGASKRAAQRARQKTMQRGDSRTKISSQRGPRQPCPPSLYPGCHSVSRTFPLRQPMMLLLVSHARPGVLPVWQVRLSAQSVVHAWVIWYYNRSILEWVLWQGPQSSRYGNLT